MRATPASSRRQSQAHAGLQINRLSKVGWDERSDSQRETLGWHRPEGYTRIRFYSPQPAKTNPYIPAFVPPATATAIASLQKLRDLRVFVVNQFLNSVGPQLCNDCRQPPTPLCLQSLPLVQAYDFSTHLKVGRDERSDSRRETLSWHKAGSYTPTRTPENITAVWNIRNKVTFFAKFQ